MMRRCHVLKQMGTTNIQWNISRHFKKRSPFPPCYCFSWLVIIVESDLYSKHSPQDFSLIEGSSFSRCHCRWQRNLHSDQVHCLLQELHAATSEDLQRCRNAHHGSTVLLQIRNRAGPSGAHVPLLEEHIPGTAADSGRPARQNSRLRWVVSVRYWRFCQIIIHSQAEVKAVEFGKILFLVPLWF